MKVGHSASSAGAETAGRARAPRGYRPVGTRACRFLQKGTGVGTGTLQEDGSKPCLLGRWRRGSTQGKRGPSQSREGHSAGHAMEESVSRRPDKASPGLLLPTTALPSRSKAGVLTA